MNERTLSLLGPLARSRMLPSVAVASSLALAHGALAQPAPPPVPPNALPPAPPSPPLPGPPNPALPAPPAPSDAPPVPSYPMPPVVPWPTAMQPYPQAPPAGEMVPAPPGSPVAPPGAPILMPQGYAAQPGLYAPVRSYENGVIIPPGYHIGTEPLRALWISGAGLFAGTYFSTVVAGAVVAGGDQDAGWFFIPIAGPLAFGASVQDDNKGSLIAGMTFVSLAQATGVAMFIGGLAAHHRVLVRNDRASVTPSFDVGPGRASFRLTF